MQEILVELVRAGVWPESHPEQTGQLVLSEGGTRPFVIERGWSGVQGRYNEQFSIRRGGRQVFYQSEPRLIFVRGMQSVTSYRDLVVERVRLEPGTYELVFLIEGLYMGHIEIQATALERAAV